MDLKTLDGFLKDAAKTPVYKEYIPFLKLARDCFAQNPIISYWSLCYVLETALKNQAKPTEEFRKFLMDIMACLEKEKKARAATDSMFANEAEAKTFIEEYGNKLLEKAEENEELYDRLDLASKLYLAASNIFQIYTCFVRDDEENAKRIKFCKWKAVECFKKKKELEENPPKPPETSDFDTTTDEPEEESKKNEPGMCPYPNQPGQSGVCPYPNFSGNDNNFPSSNVSEPGLNLPEIPSDPEPEKPKIDPIAPVKPTNESSRPEPVAKDENKCDKDKTNDQLLQEKLAQLKLSKSDSKSAELLCESALYAIRANDFLTAVDTLKQCLDLVYKRARK